HGDRISRRRSHCAGPRPRAWPDDCRRALGHRLGWTGSGLQQVSAGLAGGHHSVYSAGSPVEKMGARQEVDRTAAMINLSSGKRSRKVSLRLRSGDRNDLLNGQLPDLVVQGIHPLIEQRSRSSSSSRLVWALKSSYSSWEGRKPAIGLLRLSTVIDPLEL